MQDIHSLGPGGSGLFSGGGGGGGSVSGDRRLRTITGAALSHHLNGGHHHHHNGGGGQALKCPRCDSLNTKFCYYNNYNLSQPRHFCKSCRRYWTKGGVLRNVPVGGGCRKSKRSSKPSSSARQNSPSPSPPAAASDPPPAAPLPAPAPASNSHSSSESSSLTATNAAGTVEAVSGFSALVFEGGQPMFPDLGGLSGLMTSPSSENVLTPFGFNNSLLLGHSQQQLHEQQVEEQVWDHQVRSGVMDHEDHHHHKESSGAGGGFGPLDWQGTGGGGVSSVDQGMFDLPVINTVDQAYWSQSQWSTGDHDHPNLYLP